MNEKYFLNRLKRLEAKRASVAEQAENATDAAIVKDCMAKLDEINMEIADVTDALNEINASKPDGKSDGESGAGKSDVGMKSVGNFNLLSASGTESKNVLASTEYRTAFKNFVQKGTPINSELLARVKNGGGDPGVTTTGDIGMIIPETIMSEFIKEVDKVYGQLYSRVRKISIKGGVKFPISSLKANFKWITESTVSPEQKAGDIKDYIEFSYNIGEIRVTESLLASIVSLDMFEREIVRIMAEAYVEAMDKGIAKGTGNGQMLGILNDPRITQVIEFTEQEFADWKAWRKKLFSVVPLSKRGKGEFVFTAATVESYLLTMEDSNGRPLFKEATEITLNDSNLAGRFFGREAILVEPDIVADMQTASAGDVVGWFWVSNDYCINTDRQFGIKRYFDDDRNVYVNKGLTVVDGKMLDTSGCYLIKKK